MQKNLNIILLIGFSGWIIPCIMLLTENEWVHRTLQVCLFILVGLYIYNVHELSVYVR